MDGYREFLEYYHTLYAEDLLNKDFDSAGYDQQANLHAYNRIGMATQYTSGISVEWTLEWDPDWNEDEDELLMFPVAPLTGGCDKPFWTGRSEITPSFAINADVDEATAIAAFCFMDFMVGPEAGEIRSCGTDTTKYEIKDGFIKKLDKAWYSENSSELGSNFKGIPDNEKWNQYNGLTNYNGKALSEYAAAENAQGFTHVPTIVNCYKLTEEQEIIERYEVDFNTYCDENFSGFISGNIALTE